MEKNNQLAFDIAEKEFGISPIMTGKEMASVGEPDKLSMVMYLTQFYEMFKDTIPSSGKQFGALLWDLKTAPGSMCVLQSPSCMSTLSSYSLLLYITKCWLVTGADKDHVSSSRSKIRS